MASVSHKVTRSLSLDDLPTNRLTFSHVADWQCFELRRNGRICVCKKSCLVFTSQIWDTDVSKRPELWDMRRWRNAWCCAWQCDGLVSRVKSLSHSLAHTSDIPAIEKRLLNEAVTSGTRSWVPMVCSFHYEHGWYVHAWCRGCMVRRSGTHSATMCAIQISASPASVVYWRRICFSSTGFTERIRGTVR